jgi:prepilin-type N-terminal cleavage/methylation domain-containing protein
MSAVQGVASSSAPAERGFTLLELLVVLAIAGVVLGYGFLRIGAAADHAAVRAAVADATTTFNAARQAAIERREPIAVSIDTVGSSVTVAAGAERILRRNFAAAYAVRLIASRDSMAYDARGIGMGAANLSLIVRRGRVAETVFVSRLGRVRH